MYDAVIGSVKSVARMRMRIIWIRCAKPAITLSLRSLRMDWAVSGLISTTTVMEPVWGLRWR